MKYKVWITINKKAAQGNIKSFRSLLGKGTELWAVVKSNAYGHDLVLFSQIVDKFDIDGFCVDSVIEGMKLRENGVTKPILVLGPTLPDLYSLAVKFNITITISSIDALKLLCSAKKIPNFHLKIDTGMHRQGFYVEDLSKIISNFNPSVGGQISNYLKGVYTHFASAKDINYPTFTEKQFIKFNEAVGVLKKFGFNNLKKHVAATAGTLINQKYHLDLVRVGIGLYGLWPSRELAIQLDSKIKLEPVLSWYSIISEIKNLKKGDCVGYDFTEKVNRKSKIAIVPIGYWHGIPRDLSSIGCVLIKNKLSKILGRISMDLTVVDITGLDCKVGDKVELLPMDMAQRLGASHYEIITRINPLIKRVIK